jgi:exportin-2 (importin alpha re-exporter)
MYPCWDHAIVLMLAESDTRRQAATEFTRALMEHFERDVTEIIKGYISTFLQVCHRND